MKGWQSHASYYKYLPIFYWIVRGLDHRWFLIFVYWVKVHEGVLYKHWYISFLSQWVTWVLCIFWASFGKQWPSACQFRPKGIRMKFLNVRVMFLLNPWLCFLFFVNNLVGATKVNVQSALCNWYLVWWRPSNTYYQSWWSGTKS